MKKIIFSSAISLILISCFDNSKELAVEADNLYDAGKYSEAIEILNVIIQKHPEDTSSYFLRGKSYFNLGNFATAKNDFSEVIKLNSNAINSYFFKASCETSEQNHAQAIEDITKFLSQKEKAESRTGLIEDTNAYLLRGLSFYYLENYARAKNDLTSYSFLGGKDPKAYLCLGYMDIKSGAKKDGYTYLQRASSLGNKEAESYIVNNQEEANIYLPKKPDSDQTHNSSNNRVSFSDARSLVDKNIGRAGGSIIDSFTSKAFGPSIYTFLVTYKDHYCTMAVSELQLRVMATNCNGNALDSFYEAKKLN